MKINFLTLIIIILFIGSCSSAENEEGKINEIGIEKTAFNLCEKKDTLIIKAKVESWGIFQIIAYEDSKEFVYKNELYAQEDGKGNKTNIYKENMNGEWFSVTKKNEKLYIIVKENSSNKERKIVITLKGYVGYFPADLTVTQKGTE